MTDEHRTRARGDRLRRFEDPTLSNAPRVVAVLEHLDAAARDYAAITPRPEFRAELRAQLVAITPRIVSESAPAETTARTARTATAKATATAPHRVAVQDRPRPSPRPRAEAQPSPRPTRTFWKSLRSVPIGRPLAVVASLVTVLALILGGAVYMSRDAVPGDTLYGLKRASERFQLSLDDTDAERASDYLKFATTRVEEARELVSRASSSAAGSGPLADGALSDHTSTLVAKALQSADGNTQTASRLLGSAAVDSASPAPLTKITDWAPGQLERLAELRATVPAGSSANVAAAKSYTLLQTAKVRAATLQKRVDCNCLRNAPSDVYGPLPTSAPVPPPVTKAPKSTSPGNGGGTSKPANTKPATRPTSGPTAPKTTTPKTPILRLPTLQLPTGTRTATSQPPLLDLCQVNLLGIKLCPSKSN